jgi:cyclophilin family peptidyl-prolyl cis-trans isomerase
MRALLLVLLALICADPARSATIVRFESVLGDFEVELFDDLAPLTVANFLAYANDGDYDGSFIHRSIPGFVIQGGGYGVANNVFHVVTPRPPIVNEFDAACTIPCNVRGTIAMAKVAGNEDSATNQWFINLANNSGSPPDGLDYANGGYTVFGRVLGDGMTVVDAIAALPTATVDLPGPLPVLQNFPLYDYSGGRVRIANLVMVTKVPEPGVAVLRAGALASVLLLARLSARRRAAGRRP